MINVEKCDHDRNNVSRVAKLRLRLSRYKICAFNADGLSELIFPGWKVTYRLYQTHVQYNIPYPCNFNQQFNGCIEKTNRVTIPNPRCFETLMINRDDSYNLINRGPPQKSNCTVSCRSHFLVLPRNSVSLLFQDHFLSITGAQGLMSLLLVLRSLELSVSSCGTSSLHLFNTRGGATARSRTTSPGPR